MTTDSLLGKQLDEYRLEKLLGHGGMARVYRGIDTRLNRYVAIKVIDTPFQHDSEYIGRFEKEAQAIAQLNHPNIVTLYRYNEVEGRLYMAMQYVEGADLEKLISDADGGDPIPLEEVLSIVRQLCDALDYAHSKGVIHRDVKPSNIMLESNGHVYLTDFGLALMPEVGTMGTIFGSPHYIAPEQAMSSAAAVPQSDYYAVGVTLYELLTGRLPFDSENPMDLAMMHLSDPPPPLRQFRPDLSVDIEEVVLKLLAKEPQARYENGRALMATLDTTDTAHREELSMRPSHFIATRVSIELKNNPLPPIAAQKNASKLSILQPFTALSNQSYMPILVIGGSILVMLLCVTALVVAFLSLQDGDEPSSVSQPITVNLTSSPTATTEATPSLTPAPSPTTPPVLVPLQNGVGLSNGRRLNDGGLQVEGYCNPQYVEGYAAVSHDNEHWYCHRSRGSSDRVQLTQADFDRICQLTYSNSNAIAMQVDGPSIPAFNWKCFGPITP